ncbi:MAG: Triosephosphate isomerase [Candidatus Gottesmanbacteria bacterium GW2011_GWB1_43_11]|uniref:Triosephosphate isomerase n=1 Tax=Candidatus Gottesmanbacteria bacterium GW2011_GWB1_43_11 TaxID=1618446 RepID=A0A0G1CN79_9BACT|nr:MAG: Triosephosphate isomerase [Candidatus Gottesmanbacteria bacterium GW2011_GWA2_42_16]KKS55669.1 MAG: Triosephosphate isomerase [Candidatus Gottesmanbacteria bacterium GW2011_GWA1_42_26]KKS81480.1 MAG: Triosephosphate isomerase [Candidatus Gottesmanbacteria bacterium GW2011_GWC1_43_10]KKS86947.1 MAG: Triosephosphate isomerase [Candidatus Gottesmanbacteria bacterium GW2011_GWB1_43_11]OGG09519.1 MAG: hypothetical protein A2699_03195 [Candidatus Gottesmanbacteria bacterium RIFCSPHIGHO2_01_FU
MRTAPFYIIGNWKSNKTVGEAVIWMQDFTTLWKKQPFDSAKAKIILCAPFIHLTTLHSLIELNKLPLVLGAQTISSYPTGAYTGEIGASMVKDLVGFTLIGHSERRKYFGETDHDLSAKIAEAQSIGITSIYCVQDSKMPIPAGVKWVAYEPVWAIGTGKPETAENAAQAAAAIKNQAPDTKIIYGGSVTAENVAAYAEKNELDGVLPGGASLTPATFYHLITNATHN